MLSTTKSLVLDTKGSSTTLDVAASWIMSEGKGHVDETSTMTLKELVTELIQAKATASTLENYRAESALLEMASLALLSRNQDGRSLDLNSHVLLVFDKLRNDLADFHTVLRAIPRALGAMRTTLPSDMDSRSRRQLDEFLWKVSDLINPSQGSGNNRWLMAIRNKAHGSNEFIPLLSNSLFETMLFWMHAMDKGDFIITEQQRQGLSDAIATLQREGLGQSSWLSGSGSLWDVTKQWIAFDTRRVLKGVPIIVEWSRQLLKALIGFTEAMEKGIELGSDPDHETRKALGSIFDALVSAGSVGLMVASAIGSSGATSIPAIFALVKTAVGKLGEDILPSARGNLQDFISSALKTAEDKVKTYAEENGTLKDKVVDAVLSYMAKKGGGRLLAWTQAWAWVAAITAGSDSHQELDTLLKELTRLGRDGRDWVCMSMVIGIVQVQLMSHGGELPHADKLMDGVAATLRLAEAMWRSNKNRVYIEFFAAEAVKRARTHGVNEEALASTLKALDDLGYPIESLVVDEDDIITLPQPGRILLDRYFNTDPDSYDSATDSSPSEDEQMAYAGFAVYANNSPAPLPAGKWPFNKPRADSTTTLSSGVGSDWNSDSVASLDSINPPPPHPSLHDNNNNVVAQQPPSSTDSAAATPGRESASSTGSGGGFPFFNFSSPFSSPSGSPSIPAKAPSHRRSGRKSKKETESDDEPTPEGGLLASLGLKSAETFFTPVSPTPAAPDWDWSDANSALGADSCLEWKDFTAFFESKGQVQARPELSDRVDNLLKTERFVTIIGGPAVGKSAWMSEYALEPTRRPSIMGVWVCQYDSAPSVNDSIFVRSLALQALHWIKDIPSRTHLLETIRDSLGGGVVNVFGALLKGLPAQSPLDNPDDKALILIDSLDEAACVGCRLVSMISQIESAGPSWLRIVATSRPMRYTNLSAPNVVALTAPENEDTILSYLRTQFPGLSRSDMSQLITKSKGQILYVRFAVVGPTGLGDLDDYRNPTTKKLDLPDGLFNLYSRMSRARGWSQDQDSKDLLSMLSVAKEAIPLAMVENKTALTNLGALLALAEAADGQEALRLCHKSIRDWAVRSKLVDEARGHALLARAGLSAWSSHSYAVKHTATHVKQSGDKELLQAVTKSMILKWNWMLARGWSNVARDCEILGLLSLASIISQWAHMGDDGVRDGLAGHPDRAVRAVVKDLLLCKPDLAPLGTSPALRGHIAVNLDVTVAVALGRHLVTADEGNLRLWNLSEGECIQTFPLNRKIVSLTQVNWCSVAVGLRRNVVIVNLVTNTKVQQLDAHKGDVLALELVDPYTLVTANRRLNVFSNRSGSWKLVTTFKIADPTAGQVKALQALGSGMIASGDASAIRLWDIDGGRSLRVFSGHQREITDLAALRDNKALASAALDKKICIWEVDTGALLASFHHTSGIRALVLASDGRLAAGDERGLVTLYDQETLTSTGVLRGGHSDYVKSLVRVCSKFTLSTGSDRTTLIWRPVDAEPPSAESLHVRTTIRAAIVLDDGRVATAQGTMVTVWGAPNSHSWEEPQFRSYLNGHCNTIRTLAAAGPLIVSAGEDRTVCIWKEEGPGVWTNRFRLTGHDAWIDLVVIMPDRRTVVSMARRQLHVWDSVSGALTQTLTIGSLSTFLPMDEDRIYVGRSGCVGIVNIRTGQREGQVSSGRPQAVTSLVPVASGKLILGGSVHGPLHSYNLITGESSLLDPDGAFVVVSGVGGTGALVYRRWNGCSVMLFDYAQRRIVRSIVHLDEQITDAIWIAAHHRLVVVGRKAWRSYSVLPGALSLQEDIEISFTRSPPLLGRRS